MLETILFRNLRDYNLIPTGTSLVLGVSGGADSLCLMVALAKMKGRLGFDLHIASLNHSIRGQAGADDVTFVIQEAQRLHLPYTVSKVDVPQLAQDNGWGIEEAGRITRYQFLVDVALMVGTDRIAVAHHADDQAETILMNLIRGAGVRGLTGMSFKSPVPNHPEFILIRPLLTMRRQQIEAYCQEHHLQPRKDLSNQDTTYRRNRIRYELLPKLRDLNPQIEQSLIQLAGILHVEQDFVQRQFEANVISQLVHRGEHIIVSREDFASWHPALQRRTIQYIYSELTDSSEALSYSHITSTIDIIQHQRVGTIKQFPDGVKLRLDYKTIIFGQTDALIPVDDYLQMKVSKPIDIQLNSMTEIPNTNWSLQVSEYETESTKVHFTVSENAKLTLRTRRAGDHFAPLGLKGKHQKLKKWFIDHKIPQYVRDFIPLLCVDDEIAVIFVGDSWVIADKFAVTETSKHVVYLSIFNLSSNVKQS